MCAKLLDALVKKFEEQGDQANRNVYSQMHNECLKNGKITQNDESFTGRFLESQRSDRSTTSG